MRWTDAHITDVLVIGGGLAGERVAVESALQGQDVVILSLVPPRRSHSTAAQGGMQASLGNVAMGYGDNPDIHFADTVKGSDWGCDQEVARLFVDQAPVAVRQASSSFPLGSYATSKVKFRGSIRRMVISSTGSSAPSRKAMLRRSNPPCRIFQPESTDAGDGEEGDSEDWVIKLVSVGAGEFIAAGEEVSITGFEPVKPPHPASSHPNKTTQ